MHLFANWLWMQKYIFSVILSFRILDYDIIALFGYLIAFKWCAQHQININKSFHKIKKHNFLYIYFEGSINIISLSEHAFGMKNLLIATYFKQCFQCYKYQCWSYCYDIFQKMYWLWLWKNRDFSRNFSHIDIRYHG